MSKNKISPELNIAMETSKEERMKSLDLNVGYGSVFDEWELIIQYNGDLEEIKAEINIQIEELLGGYAIVRIPQYLINQLSEYPQIIYIEKPKSLLLEQMEGIAESCINRVRLPDLNLTGEGTIVACLDSGVDFYHRDFRKEDGSTRILTIWDQTVFGNPPEGFVIGSVYSEEDINQALLVEDDLDKRRKIVPEFDATGHGTAVLGVMAGNGLSSNEGIVGVAPRAEIIVVKLGNPNGRGFPRTTQLMLAMDYAVRYAIKEKKPLVINVSFGNNYGAHTGDSILERYMDSISNFHQLSIVTGSGNEGITARHTSGNLKGRGRKIEEIYVSPYLRSFNLQIWKQYADEFDISIVSPDNKTIGPMSDFSSVQSYSLPQDSISVYYGEPIPYNPQQEIYISWIPREEYITEGIWKIYLEPRRVVSGNYNMWLPVAGSTSSEVYFNDPTLFNTLVIPSTARSVITVAAYNSINDTYANFSGRGDKNHLELSISSGKPDLSAPGIDINTCKVGGGYALFSGTSFAAPFVSGAAALLMQYGIVEERDPYLYGEKIRAALIRGARELPFQERVPSPLVGWGALCVMESLAL